MDLEDRAETIVVRIPLADDLNSAAIDEMRRDRDAFLVQGQLTLAEIVSAIEKKRSSQPPN